VGLYCPVSGAPRGGIRGRSWGHPAHAASSINPGRRRTSSSDGSCSPLPALISHVNTAVAGSGTAQDSEPDLHQLPIDMAESAITKRTPPEPLAFVGICGIDPRFVRPCHGGQVNEASHDVNHRSHCPPGFDSRKPAISEPHAIWAAPTTRECGTGQGVEGKTYFTVPFFWTRSEDCE
jgi:hypothetical protein